MLMERHDDDDDDVLYAFSWLIIITFSKESYFCRLFFMQKICILICFRNAAGETQ